MYGIDTSSLAVKVNRKKAAFFAGNTSGSAYRKQQILKKVINRATVIEQLKKMHQAVVPNNIDEYYTFKTTLKDCSVVICERDKLSFSAPKLLEELSSFSFFLALPGTLMPLCHNLVEAMYLGCIPILQEVYSETMPEQFQHLKNALVYKDERDLKNILEDLKNFSNTQIAELKKNSLKYYDSYLSEKALVSRVIHSNYTNFYLQAEGYSIVLYQKQLALRK